MNKIVRQTRVMESETIQKNEAKQKSLMSKRTLNSFIRWVSFAIFLFIVAECGNTNNEPEPPLNNSEIPTGVNAIQSGNTVVISWSNVSGATSYKIYRSGNATGTYSQVGTATTISYTDNSPLNGNNFYKVTSVGSAGESDQSNYVSCNFTVSSGGSTEKGLYMGIIGFNDNINVRKIDLLTSTNKSQFQSFINGLTIGYATGLYYAVDNAVNMLQSATLPDTLVNVSIVTFTDGLDNASIMLNYNYNTPNAYRDAVHNSIMTTKIKKLNISAYSIGVKGGDVSDVNAFTTGLAALASNSNNVYMITSMAEINSTFRDIATSLYNESQTQSIKLKIPGGYADGTKMRFTFDNVTDAANSNYYIEGTYRHSGNTYSLQNIVYQGFKSSSGAMVNGDVSGVYVTFTFESVSTTSGGNVDTKDVQQWVYIATQTPPWQRNSEFSQSGNTEIIVEKKSSIVMLVLDCTSSLDADGANGFSQMKSAANNFIDVLTGATSTPCEFEPSMLAGTFSYYSDPDNWNESGTVTLTADPNDPYKVYINQDGIMEAEEIGNGNGNAIELNINPSDFSITGPKTIIAPDLSDWGMASYTNYYFTPVRGSYSVCDKVYTITFLIGVDQGTWGNMMFTFTPK